MDDSNDNLTVRVAGKGGGYITADSLAEVVGEMVKILHELDADHALIWKLQSASTQSPLTMTFVAEPAPDAKELEARLSSDYIEMFRRLEQGIEPEAGVPEAALRSAKRLVNVLNDGVGSIAFTAPDKATIAPTQRVQAAVDALVGDSAERHSTHAALEGVLTTVTIEKGYKFYIRDRLTNHRTECRIAQEQMEAAKGAMEQRVSVTGRVQYRAGKPTVIDVEEFETMPDRRQLPQFDDVRGIDVTNGQDSVAFLREGSDA